MLRICANPVGITARVKWAFKYANIVNKKQRASRGGHTLMVGLCVTVERAYVSISN